MNLTTGFKRFGLFLLVASLLLAVPIARQAYAQADDSSDESPDYSGVSEGFSIGFANTYGYDYCDDQEIGDRLRKVWWKFLDYCDLSTQQKSVIRKNFEWATQNIPSQIPEMRKQWASPIDPDSDEAESRDFHGLFHCDQDSYRSKKAKMEAMLDEIEQGSARPDAILPEPCKQ